MSQIIGAFFQADLLLRRKSWSEDCRYPVAADDAGKRERDAEVFLITTDWNCRVLVAQNHFGDTRRYDANPILTGVMTFDDRDIGVAHVAFELPAYCIQRFTPALDKISHRH